MELRLPCQHFKNQDTQTPPVCSFAITFGLNNLWSYNKVDTGVNIMSL
jgi:hypothetical protein